MSARFSLLLLLAVALSVVGCGPGEEPTEGGLDEEAGGLVLGSAAEWMVMEDAEEEDADGATEAGGSTSSVARGGGTAARGGSDATSSSGQAGSAGSSSSRGGSSGPAAPSLSDPGLGRAGGQTISADQIQATISQNQGQVRACYERELKTSPSLRGKVKLSWTIGADGRVRAPRVVRNSTGNRELSSCIKRAVRGWAFPRAQSPQDVEYPFVFKSREF